MTTAMEHRLERYQDQQDAEYATSMNEPREAEDDVAILYEERRHVTYEINAIEGVLATDDKYSLVTPEHWNERLAECKARIAMIDTMLEREKLIHEQKVIQGTIDLHCKGLIKCNMRILEIEAQLKQMEVGQ
jgi:hypothetical protein